MKKMLLQHCSLSLCSLRSFAQVVVRIGPRLRCRASRSAPGAGFVWIDGYHRWEGDHYVWTPAAGSVPSSRRSLGGAQVGA